MNRLKRLRDLHSTPDRITKNRSGRLEISGSKVSDLRIGVDNDFARVASFIGDNAEVNFGLAKVPLKSLFNLVSMLTRGNQLRSSLHRYGTILLLAAELRKGGAWRIEREVPDDAPKEKRAMLLEEMLTELVYSVFCAQAGLPGPSWKPLEHLSKGVRALWDARANQADRYGYLRKAEENLLKVRGLEPHGSTRCSYLLGTVYVELELLAKDQLSRNSDQAASWNAAARAAFTQALQDDPRNVDAAYAIAWQACGRGVHDEKEKDQYAFAVEFADRMIAVKRTDARAWNIRGVALRALRQRESWKGSVDNSESAAQYLWQDLCVSAWSGEVSPSLRQDQADYFTNLGLALKKAGFHRKSRRILHQALYHNPASQPALELAKMLDEKMTANIIRQFPYFSWLIRIILGYCYRRPPSETMFMNSLFANNKIDERAQIRVSLAVSLLDWRKKALDSGFSTVYYQDRIREALVKLLESPSLVRPPQWQDLANTFEKFSSKDRLIDCLPNSFYIKRTENNSEIVLSTTLYEEAKRYDVDDLVSESTKSEIRFTIDGSSTLPAQVLMPDYTEIDVFRNPFVWILAFKLILHAKVNIYASMHSKKEDSRKYLKFRIDRMNDAIRLLDNENAFQRENMLIGAYKFLSTRKSDG